MKKKIYQVVILFVWVTLIGVACKKENVSNLSETEQLSEDKKKDKDHGHLKQTKTFSSDVVKRWLAVQTGMLYRPSGNPFGFNPSRYMAYCGVALYESVVKGMPDYQSLQGQLTDMPAMPSTERGRSYHWPTSANAALATLTRKFYSLVPAAYNATAVDNLENELNALYLAEVGASTHQRSLEYGKEIANRIFTWAQTDNAAWPTVPYTLPAYYPGMWQPETGAPVNPYWGYNRLMVPGSLNNVASPPLAYSTNPSSQYYKNMYEVYAVSQNLTREQKRIAKYYNDSNPGYPAGSHYISVFKQLIEQLKPSLDVAALAYAKTGITLFDASTGSFKVKYTHLAERPFQFIRATIVPGAIPAWQPYLATPGFPDFASNHAIFSTSVAYALTSVFGKHVKFNNASYEGLMVDLGNGLENLGTRRYNSFDEMAAEISISRLYGGIHYRYSCEEGQKQGRKTAENIDRKLKFRRGGHDRR